MKSLLSILTAAAFVFVAVASPALAGDEKKTSGGATSGTTGADQGSSASPKTGADQGSSASPSGAGTTAEKPANKDECKDDGWQKFGFKNQGECVSSVAPEKKTTQ